MSRTFTSTSMSPAMYYAIVEGSHALLGFRQEAATMLCSCQADLVLRRSSHSLMQVAVYSKECATWLGSDRGGDAADAAVTAAYTACWGSW